ncbi:helix-turn-helix domain-containing protein [Chloroflexota bacterium]
METADNNSNLGNILKRQRLMTPLTLRELAKASGISPSHLGRIERGERFPSASVLKRISQPLGFEESELFFLAGYLSPIQGGIEEEKASYTNGRLDPHVSSLLGAEPVEVQRAAIGILTILKSIAKASKGE